MSTFLTQEELEDMTGKKQAAAQRRVLDRNGIRYIVRGDGRNSVTRDQIEARQPPRPAGPDLEALARLS